MRQHLAIELQNIAAILEQNSQRLDTSRTVIEEIVLPLQQACRNLTAHMEVGTDCDEQTFETADHHMSEAFVALQLGRQRANEAMAHFNTALYHFKETIKAGTPE